MLSLEDIDGYCKLDDIFNQQKLSIIRSLITSWILCCSSLNLYHHEFNVRGLIYLMILLLTSCHYQYFLSFLSMILTSAILYQSANIAPSMFNFTVPASEGSHRLRIKRKQSANHIELWLQFFFFFLHIISLLKYN